MYERRQTDTPLAESSVSQKLARIQKRCSELMEQNDELELTLEEPAAKLAGNDPYNRQI